MQQSSLNLKLIKVTCDHPRFSHWQHYCKQISLGRDFQKVNTEKAVKKGPQSKAFPPDFKVQGSITAVVIITPIAGKKVYVRSTEQLRGNALLTQIFCLILLFSKTT